MISHIRHFFEFVSILDWITPLRAFKQDWDHGGPVNLNAWAFFIPNDTAISSGWSGNRIDSLMAEYGIETWGKLTAFGEYTFTVPLWQAYLAEGLLNKYGVPIHSRSQGAPRVKRPQTRLTRKSNKNGRSEVSTS